MASVGHEVPGELGVSTYQRGVTDGSSDEGFSTTIPQTCEVLRRKSIEELTKEIVLRRLFCRAVGRSSYTLIETIRVRAVLLIDEPIVEGADIIIDRKGRTGLSITRSGEGCKELLYLLLIGCRVDIPDDDHALQVGAVPSLVEGLDIGILEGLQHVETPDDIALGVL